MKTLTNNESIKPLLLLVLDYIRWTQLTPMLIVWGFALLMLMALTLVNFQEQSISALDRVMQWLANFPVLGDYVTAKLKASEGELQMDENHFKSFVLSAWFATSLVFMLGNMALSALIGPFQPWSLKRKILVMASCIILLMFGFLFSLFFGSETFHGGTFSWILHFSLIALLLFLVSTYSLSIAHFLGFLGERLVPVDRKKGPDIHDERL